MNLLEKNALADISEATLSVLDEILRELKTLNARLGNGSASSVEVKTSTRGTDVSVKAYEGSDVQAAGDAAVAEYTRVQAALVKASMDGFAATVEAAKVR